MKLHTPYVTGTFIKRYKRFFCDVQLDNGDIVTAHCPNTGRMTSCLEEGWQVRLSVHDSPKRKLPYTLDLIHNGTCWIAVNTQLANKVALEGILAGDISTLDGFERVEREQKIGDHTRIDLVGYTGDQPCYIEVKTVTLLEGDTVMFPDAVSERGRKHLEVLTQLRREGARAVMLFVVMRSDGAGFDIARHIDPKYGMAFDAAMSAGVECIVHGTTVGEESVTMAMFQREAESP